MISSNTINIIPSILKNYLIIKKMSTFKTVPTLIYISTLLNVQFPLQCNIFVMLTRRNWILQENTSAIIFRHFRKFHSLDKLLSMINLSFSYPLCEIPRKEPFWKETFLSKFLPPKISLEIELKNLRAQTKLNNVLGQSATDLLIKCDIVYRFYFNFLLF